MKKADFEILKQENAFDLIGKEWMLVTAGTREKFNTMTASWGGIGWLWNKPVAFVFVRPERYTYEFTERENRMTLSFLGEAGRDALKFCGSNSGRNTDKMAATGLTPCQLESGAVAFEQARLILDCRKLFKASMQETDFIDKEVLSKWYSANPGGSLHDVYVVEIEAIYSAGIGQ
jgi:flavin reductase (DIM6/NTAB) family NADH-FMN oxidoreductase RutF